MGITGTFEGYVPTVTDLYLRGNNIRNLVRAGNNNRFKLAFESGQITASFAGMSGYIATDTAQNLTGHNGIACEGYSLTDSTIRMSVNTQNGVYCQDEEEASADTNVETNKSFVAKLNISAINASRYIHIGSVNAVVYVYRVWFY
ncbi:MAG: hypothetical protein KH230_20370 [Enterocloster asparagiformis]|nr:hypothetical protein [Enterocloster asparagiformis]